MQGLVVFWDISILFEVSSRTALQSIVENPIKLITNFL